MTAARRPRLPRNASGLPEERKYPLDTPGRTVNAKARATQQAEQGDLPPAAAVRIRRRATRRLASGGHDLNKPPEVEAATEDWRAENDNIGRLIDDCCVTGDAFSARAGVLYFGLPAMGREIGREDHPIRPGVFIAADFPQIRKERRQKGRYYAGIGLRLD
jgi:hypothetical protein